MNGFRTSSHDRAPAGHGKPRPGTSSGGALRILLATVVAALAASAGPSRSAPAASGASPTGTPAGTTGTGSPEVDKLAALQRSIAEDDRELRRLQTEFDAPESDYRKAEREVRLADGELAARTAELKQLREKGDADAVKALETRIAELTAAADRVRKRFAVALEERRGQRVKIEAIENRIAQQREELDKLSGAGPAEKIARLRQVLEGEEAEFARLTRQLESGAAAQRGLETAARADEDALLKRQADLAKLRDAKPPAAEADLRAAEAAVAAANEKLIASRRAYESADLTRAAVRDRAAALEQSVARRKADLAKLTAPPVTAPAGTGTATNPATSAGTDPTAPAGKTVTPPTGPTAKADTPKPAPPAIPGLPAGLIPGTGSAGPTGQGRDPAAATGPGPGGVGDKPPSPEEEKLQRLWDSRRAAAARAEDDEAKLRGALAEIGKLVDAERSLADSARRSALLAADDKAAAERELAKLTGSGAPRARLDAARAAVDDAARRIGEARDRVNQSDAALERLGKEHSALEARLKAAVADVTRLRAEADATGAELAALRDPWSVRNVLPWLAVHALRSGGIVLGVLAAVLVVRRLTRRIADAVVKKVPAETAEQRANQVQTVAGVFQNAATVFLVLAGVVLVLGEFGLNITVLAGGAAVVGVAVAFGSQNLIRDYFAGFVILAENQYTVNDVIKITGMAGLTGTSGVVERITLRVTVLRDIDGTVHFIPNGAILAVSNMTHEWSRALFDVAVNWDADVEEAMELISQTARDLRKDPIYGPLMSEDIEMLGVETLAPEGITIRFFIKTRPIHQWTIRRQMFRRIIRRFREAGIGFATASRNLKLAEGTEELFRMAAARMAPGTASPPSAVQESAGSGNGTAKPKPHLEKPAAK